MLPEITMNESLDEKKLKVIEVPPELQGLSDEEILQMDLKKRSKRDRFRPSKRERELLKKEQLTKRMRVIAEEYEKKTKNGENLNSPGVKNSKPMPKLSDYEGDIRTLSKKEEPKPGLFFHKRELPMPDLEEKKNSSVPKSVISTPPKPSSGRVLKLSFGGRGLSGIKAKIVSVNDPVEEKPVEKKRGRGRPPKQKV